MHEKLSGAKKAYAMKPVSKKFPHCFEMSTDCQITNYYSPNMKLDNLKDTRPVFLGGKYKSKIEAKSKVAEYIRGHEQAALRPI